MDLSSNKELSSYYSSIMTDHQGGDSSSADDVESPRSPAARSSETRRRRRWSRTADEMRKSRSSGCLHSQVLRIKEEESQIGADFVGDYFFDGFNNSQMFVDDQAVGWSRTNLPASPLGGRRMRQTSH